MLKTLRFAWSGFFIAFSLSVHGFTIPATWDAPPAGLKPEVVNLHVTSKVTKTEGENVTIYHVDAWYFSTELVVRVRSKDSDIIGYEEKVKSQARYWEKGIDQSTPYFPKEWLDGFLTDLVAYADFWFRQPPFRLIVKPVASHNEKSADGRFTTTTLKMPLRGGNTFIYYSQAMDDNRVISSSTSIESNGLVERNVTNKNYSKHHDTTLLPQEIISVKTVRPFTVIKHNVSRISPIPSGNTAQSILASLTKGYRPIEKARLNDPQEQIGAPAFSWHYVGIRAIGFIFVLLVLGYVAWLNFRGRRT